ncbi:MAG: ATP-binding protein, partial [Tenuifilaceae bacterium]
MKELALHILDIAQNSIVAGATLIRIGITEDMQGDLLHMTVEDNGKGMPSEMVERVMNPYTTSRTTRRVGMGLPLLHDA